MKRLIAAVISMAFVLSLVLSLGASAFAGLQYDGRFTFSSVDMYGNTVTDDYFRQNKVTIVSLWEAWCSPCVAEVPVFAQLYDAYNESGLGILGVCYSSILQKGSIAEGETYNREVVEENGATYPNVRFTDDFYDIDKYGRTGTTGRPQNFLVDSEGKIIKVTAMDWINIYMIYNSVVAPYNNLDELGEDEMIKKIYDGIYNSMEHEDDDDWVNFYEIGTHNEHEWAAIFYYFLTKDMGIDYGFDEDWYSFLCYNFEEYID